MANDVKNFSQALYNHSGYVLFLPEIAVDSDLNVLDNPVEIYEEKSSPLFPVGCRAMQGNEEWVYFKNGASDLTIAAPIQQAAVIHAELPDDIVVGAVSAIGAYTVTLTSTANLAASPLSTKDGFKNGYLIVNDGVGEGQLYKIKGHEAASGTANFVVTLYKPLTVALDTTSEVGLMQPAYQNLIVCPATLTGAFVGLPQLGVTANYYAWGKTKGIAAANCSGAINIGQQVVVGASASKVTAFGVTSTTTVIIGTAATLGVTNGEKCMVKLAGIG